MYLPKRQTYFARINKELFPMYVASLGICNNKCYLQQEPWAFRHECEGHHWGDTGECTDDHKHTPTVKLVGRSHAEAPSWKRRMGRVRENTSQTIYWGSGDSAVMVGVYISTFSVKSYYPQKNELIWALATVTTNGTTNSDRTTNSSAEKKGTWNQKGQGLKMRVYICFCTTKFWRPR